MFWKTVRLLGAVIPVVGLAAMGIMAERRAQTWRDTAYLATDAATVCTARLKEQIEYCAEDINGRSKSAWELAEAFCRERVGGCDRLESLSRLSDGVYQCRCLAK